MSGVRFLEPLIEQQVDGTALSNTTTPTSILAAAAKFTLPANFFMIGKELRLRASGRFSTTTGTNNMTLDVKFGSTTVFSSGAVVLGASSTNLTWIADMTLTCRAIGTSANLMGTGTFFGLTASTLQMLPASAPAVGSNFDSTVAFVIDLFGTWSAANASNSITTHQFHVWSPN